MKKQIKYLTPILALLIMSCASIKDLPNNSYIYKSKNRILELSFNDDKTCLLRNTFECSGIEDKYRVIEITCDYSRNGDKIILFSRENNYDGDLYINIPPQENSECSFLTSKGRERNIIVGPSYATEYEEYGLVPNIKKDTLHIIKNKIVLYKGNENQSIGFTFKKKSN